MGTWGEGPFDNDDAADLICRISKPIDIVGNRKSTESARYHYNEARAVVQFLLLAHGTDILGGPELLPCVRACARIRRVADLLETSGIAPWDGTGEISAEGAIVRGYAEGANDARKYEREACAQIAAGYGAYAGALDATRAANEIAAEIRARGK